MHVCVIASLYKYLDKRVFVGISTLLQALCLGGGRVGRNGFNGPLRQYFSLYRALSQREGDKGEKG